MKSWRPKSKYMRSDATQATRELRKWHAVDDCTQPHFVKDVPHPGLHSHFSRWKEIENEKALFRQRELILYVAAVAQKHGHLPADLREYEAIILEQSPACGYVAFIGPSKERWEFCARFLDWAPQMTCGPND